MERRRFVKATLSASVLPLTASAIDRKGRQSWAGEKELYELRTYDMKFRGNAKLLLSYLNDALKPSLMRAGVNHFMLFEELGNSDPKQIRLLISYPSASVYLKGQNLNDDADFVSKASEYTSLGPNEPIFNRFSSSLLLAFDGLPQMMNPVNGAGLFELRTYEGYSEDAVRRKIKMFNDGELPLFLEVGLHPVFFGEMISGPYRPCLTYMLNFKDMEEHDSNWQKFIGSPVWDKLKVKEEYANTVSNIRKTFLKPI